MKRKNNTIILGIETSCDETAAAVVEVRRGKFSIRANTVISQINIHKRYGGVVPELAARKHVQNLIPIISQTLAQARLTPDHIGRVAVTVGPGLISALLVGVQTAKTLAYIWHKPIVPINHLQAHLYAVFLNNAPVRFPAIGLIVSGGHTELILLKTPKQMKKIGTTLDDAAGEAFDKVARLLDLDYPGGPVVAAAAAKFLISNFEFRNISLPRPMIDSGDFNFSFSGLKTAVLYTVKKMTKKELAKNTPAICYAFQQAVVDVLVAKTIKSAQAYRVKTVILSGGVAANQQLRKNLAAATRKQGLHFVTPPINLCTDNAAMVAMAGYFSKPVHWSKVKADPGLEITK